MLPNLVQIWFNGTQAPVISKVLEYKYIWYKKWGNYKPGIFQPYLVGLRYKTFFFFVITVVIKKWLNSSRHSHVPSETRVAEKEVKEHRET
jgi:hypothetical protein